MIIRPALIKSCFYTLLVLTSFHTSSVLAQEENSGYQKPPQEMIDIVEAAVSRSVIINGKGKYLMPGLVDMHVHLPEGNKIELWEPPANE